MLKPYLPKKKPYFTIDERYGRIIENYLYPVFDDAGNVTRIAIYGRDITEQHEALGKIQESEERYRALAESSTDAIFILDLDMRFTYVNRQAEEFVGLSQQHIIGKMLDEILPDGPAYQAKTLFSEVIKAVALVSDEMEVMIHEISHWYDVRLIPLFSGDGMIQSVMGTVRDISERKQLELSIREALQKLRVLTGITRHDVINDLSIILMSLEMLHESEDEETRERFIKRATDAGKILQRTIDFTREYENFGTISEQWLSLFPIIRQSVLDVSMMGIELIFIIPPELEVFADPIMRKVFSSLLDNSSRHGKHVTRIQISTSVHEDGLYIIYDDNGVGISDKEKDLIFHHGYGKHTGLGLFLSKEILSIMGMTIHERGLEGTGARFEIFIPKGAYRLIPASVPQ